MQTIELSEAAEFLHMNPEVLRRKAKSGAIPGMKAGKRWIFVKEHLADWISGRYPVERLNLRVMNGGKTCHSTKETKYGGSNSICQTDKEYNDLLKPKTNSKPKNFTTN